jgi:hypothetical protein
MTWMAKRITAAAKVYKTESPEAFLSLDMRREMAL